MPKYYSRKDALAAFKRGELNGPQEPPYWVRASKDQIRSALKKLYGEGKLILKYGKEDIFGVTYETEDMTHAIGVYYSDSKLLRTNDPWLAKELGVKLKKPPPPWMPKPPNLNEGWVEW